MKLILSDRRLDIRVKSESEIYYFDLSSLRIAGCTGCFGCWVRTPGRCVIRDDAPQVYSCMAESDAVLYVSRLKYGGYDTIMKTMLERAIPVQKAFIRIHCGETHHVQRLVVPKRATLIVYGAEDKEECDIFRQLAARNARNMNFESYEIVFTTESMVDVMVRNVLQKWERS